MAHRDSARGKTILLVEDDFLFRASLAELLTSQGYTVECAAHGLEAFDRLSLLRPKPSVILLDLMMPHMGGIAFRSLQRALPDVADVPVVVITANPACTVDVEELDVAQTFYKPVNTSRLLETIDALSAAAA